MATFCCVVNSIVATGLGPGVFQILHSRQLSTMSATCAMIVAGRPAALSTRSIGARGACHHLRCNFLSSLTIWAGVPARRVLKLFVMLNDVQSLGFSPVALATILGWSSRGLRSCRSGPLPLRGRPPASASVGSSIAAGAVAASEDEAAGAEGAASGGSSALRSGPAMSAPGSRGAGVRASRGYRPPRTPRRRSPIVPHRHWPGSSV